MRGVSISTHRFLLEQMMAATNIYVHGRESIRAMMALPQGRMTKQTVSTEKP
jgi:hypothetical protein